MKSKHTKGYLKSKLQKYHELIHKLKKIREGQITQGTIEYLILLALITGVGLVIVAVFVNLFEAPSSQLTSSTGHLSTMLFGEVAVLDTSLDSEGDVAMELKNNGVESITITKIKIGGQEKDLNNTNIGGLGNSKVIKVNISAEDCACGEIDIGKNKVCTVEVDIVKSSGITKSSGSQKMSVECVGDVIGAAS